MSGPAAILSIDPDTAVAFGALTEVASGMEDDVGREAIANAALLLFATQLAIDHHEGVLSRNDVVALVDRMRNKIQNVVASVVDNMVCDPVGGLN